MKYTSRQQRYAIEQKNRKRLKAINPDLDDNSGIYFLTMQQPRAYIGQSIHITQRLCEHLAIGAHQHIDLSLRKHGLYDAEKNPYGWKVGFIHYPKDKLDEMEQYWIKEYQDAGYELLNKTAGGQGEGKEKIADFRPAKGYRDGIKQGRKNLAKELLHIIEKHLIVAIRPEKQNNKVSQEQFDKFWHLLKDDDTERE